MQSQLEHGSIFALAIRCGRTFFVLRRSGLHFFNSRFLGGCGSGTTERLHAPFIGSAKHRTAPQLTDCGRSRPASRGKRANRIDDRRAATRNGV